MGLVRRPKKLEKYRLIFFYSVKAVKLNRYILYLGGHVFLCPRGQGVGSAPDVHESPQ